MSKVIEYDHIANDRDTNELDCDQCGGAGDEYKVRKCANPKCDINVCCDCRAKSEVYAELDVCCDECAVEVIVEMRSQIERLLRGGKEMMEALRFIEAIRPAEMTLPNDLSRADSYPYALGMAQGRAAVAVSYGKFFAA